MNKSNFELEYRVYEMLYLIGLQQGGYSFARALKALTHTIVIVVCTALSTTHYKTNLQGLNYNIRFHRYNPVNY